MTEYENAKQLAIENHNNKLLCDAFIDINFAPPAGKVIRESDWDRIYVIKHQDENIFVKLTQAVEVKFIDIKFTATLAATGLDPCDWAVEWLKKHPETQNDTMMAVYAYKRLK